MQVYGHILPGAGRVANALPRAAAAARADLFLSRSARQRLKMLHWYEDHGRNARLTCRHFGVSPDTFYRWRRRYQRAGPRALEDRSHQPRRVRQPTWSPTLAQAVLRLREEHPRWARTSSPSCSESGALRSRLRWWAASFAGSRRLACW